MRAQSSLADTVPMMGYGCVCVGTASEFPEKPVGGFIRGKSAVDCTTKSQITQTAEKANDRKQRRGHLAGMIPQSKLVPWIRSQVCVGGGEGCSLSDTWATDRATVGVG